MSTITDRLSLLSPADRNTAYVIAGYLALKSRCQRDDSVNPTNLTPILPAARKTPGPTISTDFDIKATRREPRDFDLNPQKRN